MRHLLALRLQSVYTDFLAADAARQSNGFDSLCGECLKLAAPNGANQARPQCRHSEVDEEPAHVRYQRILHGLVGFYKSAKSKQTGTIMACGVLGTLMLMRLRCLFVWSPAAAELPSPSSACAICCWSRAPTARTPASSSQPSPRSQRRAASNHAVGWG